LFCVMNKSKNSTENEVSNRKLRFSVVCSSNMNRSMEAHAMLQKKGFNVRSFGSGSLVKLPGPSPTVHNIYSFSTPYEEIYKDLVAKDKNLYTQNGLLNMLDRNRRVKPHPERFQEYKGLLRIRSKRKINHKLIQPYNIKPYYHIKCSDLKHQQLVCCWDSLLEEMKNIDDNDYERN
ncbi:RNA polymerase II subunit A C-terminal domain phosphatase SSU72, partial [Trichinella papuae]